MIMVWWDTFVNLVSIYLHPKQTVEGKVDYILNNIMKYSTERNVISTIFQHLRINVIDMYVVTH